MMGSTWSQFFPPAPQFTEANIGNLSGKVFIVTGANSGIGKNVAQVIYAKGGKVYLAARSETKVQEAIQEIQAAVPESKGALVYLHLDLADLSTIKASATAFLAQEKQLHVLVNNAGVMIPPQGSKTAQGYELQLGTNCIGHFLFAKLLRPVLEATAKTAAANSVRIVWVASSAVELLSHRPGGVDLTNLNYHVDKEAWYKYGVSKAGNFLHATEYARRYSAASGVVSVGLDPGNLNTNLTRHTGYFVRLLIKPLLHPAIYGAYTELFASFSPDVTVERVKTDYWIVPWGRFKPIRADLAAATKPKSEGGTGEAEAWWEWNEEQVKAYL